MDVRLHEVGRFALGLEKERFAGAPQVKRIEDYVVKRQNDDGGYAFAQGLDSNAQDTYYGLAILDLLKIPFPSIKKTIRWLHDFVPDSHYSHYYVAKALKLCGEKPQRSLKDFLLSLQSSKGEFGTGDVYVEVASEFQSISMITELANMVGVEIDHDKTASWLLSYQNKDGGFGAHEHSNLNSTYHAVASLFNLGYPVKSLRGILEYVRSCEKPSGGFSVVPTSSIPYMEHVYYGVSTLDLLGERVRYPEKTAEFVLRCQNSNGGFARSDLGISTFEDTFYAVSILRMIRRQ
ncbi:MAG: prenyltransferase/squalene oxidase repeat-containing protein [Candidatus Bathycorpusculaceae bacterium]